MIKRRRGFTMVELMVALTVGGLIVAAVFAIGGGSAHHFQEQQRVGVLQRSVREALDRMRRDVGRAGYLGVPSNRAPRVVMCQTPAIPRNVQAIWFDDADATGVAALAQVNGPNNRVSADRLRLTGNYSTGDGYLVRSMNTSGNMLWLQTDWQAFRRSFVATYASGTVVDVNRFQDTFRSGRMLHIETRSHSHIIVNIVSSSVDTGATSATVTISPALGTSNPCIEGLLEGAIVSPISEVEYYLDVPPGDSNLNPRAVAVTGVDTQLVRHELDMQTGQEIVGSRRVVLDYAVDFGVEFILDTNPTIGNPPSLVRRDGPASENPVQSTPWQVRSAIISLAGRSPTPDVRFPWPNSWGTTRPAGTALSRYRVFADSRQVGAARVRTLATEVVMPNLVPR